jgi:DNA-binding transcriptional regulator YiaG
VSAKEGAVRLPAEKRAILLAWGAQHRANLAEQSRHNREIKRLRAERRLFGNRKSIARKLDISTRTVANYLRGMENPK